jgi:hypothetical protein
LATLALFVSFFMFAPMSLAIAASAQQEFRWAADPEGGAPFVEADPARCRANFRVARRSALRLRALDRINWIYFDLCPLRVR